MGSSLDVARWQFAITTVYHFLFVPVTIGMSAVVAYFHTQWVRTHRPEYYRLTKFLGKLFLINFALGLVTGIVQEFQFGMNWSDYSRFVGDIFGAPLAFEALLAFFLESTFLGVWIFGWGRIPEKLHASTMWLTHIGTVLSAYFILAANSFMQNPVGYRFNPETGRAEMADFVAVLTNKVQLVTFPHVLFGSYMVGGAVVMGVALWLLRRDAGTDDEPVYRKAVRVGAVVSLVASLGVVVSGDVQGKIMTEVQPMKMAAAEALYETTDNAPFSVLSIGSLDGSEATRIIEVPGLLSFLGTGSFSGTVDGIDELKDSERAMADEVAAQYGPDVARLVAAEDYTPIIPVAYWTFRLMMGFGFLTMLFAGLALWATRKSAVPQARWWTWVAVLTPLLPVLANSWGWIFTEMGRQPWLVYGLMTTATGVSPSVSVGEVWVSMVVYTLLYAALAVVEVKLFLTYVRKGAEPFVDPAEHADADEDAPLQFAY
ncbi:cytochrome ubiquinol oxidase subunit I [Phycicoccus sp. CSK15P-2]|uniref:cytochrome ubiquinol oxidase subunit I n=1 Tax=Phycicoccus sp. CSK15P-2 TaxID=2807627 RepID=UPI00195157B6|nr:cytochrome ubiquinol oxidase subunit I [Phycicoccus sp. CSK15P-2]MBM6403376.1 cytochrome ubiquinol oxidase subunit I [Phycicoccus sp. CSK15P-2]